MKQERSLSDTAPPKSGALNANLSNPTKAARNAAKIGLECPMCGLKFERYACWARRVDNNYCSKACANEAKVVKVSADCSVCAAQMLIKPSYLGRVTTCGEVCASQKKRSRGHMHTFGNWAAYREAAEAVAAKEVCDTCGATHGPWVVRGICMQVEDGKLPLAYTSVAKLLCQPCHLTGIAAFGGKSRWRLGAKTAAH